MMGVLANTAGPLGYLFLRSSATLLIVSGVVTFVVLAIVLNVLHQLLFKNPNEPPVVFHWVPVIGSTILYGIDPYKFFFSCREKVFDMYLAMRHTIDSATVWRCVHVHSTWEKDYGVPGNKRQ